MKLYTKPMPVDAVSNRGKAMKIDHNTQLADKLMGLFGYKRLGEPEDDELNEGVKVAEYVKVSEDEGG